MGFAESSSTELLRTASTIILFLLVMYGVPTFVAALRKHASFGGIVVINLLLGWTIIGWIIALAWSLSDPRRNQQTIIIQSGSPLDIVQAPHPFTPPAAVHVPSEPRPRKIANAVRRASLRVRTAIAGVGDYCDDLSARFGKENLAAFLIIGTIVAFVSFLVIRARS